jgi:hypothetical protein
LAHKVVRQVLALFYLPRAEQILLQEQVGLEVLAQVLQHCVETLLRLVGQEEQQLLAGQEAAVEAHPMVLVVQEVLAPPT